MVEISVMQRFLYWGRNMLSLVHYNGACMLILRLGTHSLTHPPTTPTHLNRVIIRAANNVLSATESCRVDRFRVSLKYVHWVNGRSSEVPESKSRILWWGNEQLLSGMGTDMGQLKVVTCVCVRGGGGKVSNCIEMTYRTTSTMWTDYNGMKDNRNNNNGDNGIVKSNLQFNSGLC